MKTNWRLAIVSSLVTFLLAAPAGAQEACFKSEPLLPWQGDDIGAVLGGASRHVAGAADGYELCSISTGFDGAEDSLRYVHQKTRADFEFVARLDKITPAGMGGVMATVNFRTLGSAYVAIAAHLNAAGGVELRSTVRAEDGDKVSSGNSQPVPFGLPVFLKVRRQGSVLTTSFSRDGQTFKDHLVVKADGGLTELFLYVGMAQASESRQTPASAIFDGPRIHTQETEFPPRLAGVDPPNSPVEGGVPVTITGENLADTQEVVLAGIKAQILKITDTALVVLSGPAKEPRSGDVLVVNTTSEDEIKNGFFYLGVSYRRGDFDGNLSLDIGDAVGLLTFLFLGGKPPNCIAAADVNGDGALDIGDPVRTLNYLFLGGSPPPEPFERPGITSSPSLPCGLPALPRILKLSQDTIRQGDVVTLTGQNFSPDPELNQVFFGSSPAEVLRATSSELVVKAGPFLTSELATIGVITGYHPPTLIDCRLTGCNPIHVGLASLADIVARVLASDVVVAGSGKPKDQRGQIIIPIDRQKWRPDIEYKVNARLLVPAVNGLSRGSLFSSFQYENSTPETQFPEWLQGLASRLRGELGGDEVGVTADAERSLLLIQVQQGLQPFLDQAWLGSIISVLWDPPIGKCGPTNLDPVADRRAFGWCRFAELIAECGGRPKWEYFIPTSKVFQASSSIFPLPFPQNESPGTKGVLYNLPAYCHVRNHGLYKTCVLDNLVSTGHTTIPDFPRSAIVIKTSWRTAAQMSGKTLSKHYSYTYSGDGQTYYLVAFHFTTKDINNWYWADFYVPMPDGFGGCLGDGSDRPAAITGVWANYLMCTNIVEVEPICGNNVFPECGNNTCIGCHKNEANYSGMATDFLPSIPSDAISGPPACP
jgi:hypothetical protein